MYPYIRSIHALLSARKLPPMGLYDTHVSHHRAWPWDTDMFGELNNGRILTLFELGRWQMTVRLGLLKPFLTGKITLLDQVMQRVCDVQGALNGDQVARAASVQRQP